MGKCGDGGYEAPEVQCQVGAARLQVWIRGGGEVVNLRKRGDCQCDNLQDMHALLSPHLHLQHVRVPPILRPSPSPASLPAGCRSAPPSPTP